MPRVEKLNALVGSYVNLEYPLPNGAKVKLLDDNVTYLGNQIVGTAIADSKSEMMSYPLFLYKKTAGNGTSKKGDFQNGTATDFSKKAKGYGEG